MKPYIKPIPAVRQIFKQANQSNQSKSGTLTVTNGCNT